MTEISFPWRETEHWNKCPGRAWSPSLVTAEADLHHLPSQTDFKAADADVNTDQDIEKNLVGIEALGSGLGSATRTPRQRNCSCSSHFIPVKIESQNHYGWKRPPRPSNIRLEVLKLSLLQRNFALHCRTR